MKKTIKILTLIVAVAALVDMACIILAEGVAVDTDTVSVIDSVTDSFSGGYDETRAVGGDHNHIATVTEGNILASISEEESQTWENVPIKIEPNYYSLIFIMKL